MKNNLLTVLVLAWAGVAPAQHVDVLVWDDGGRVGVGEYDFDNQVPTDSRVQIGRLAGPDGPEAYTASAPGFIALTGSDALPGSQFLEWDFLPMTVDSGPNAGYRSTLLYWDGLSEDPEFGPTPRKSKPRRMSGKAWVTPSRTSVPFDAEQPASVRTPAVHAATPSPVRQRCRVHHWTRSRMLGPLKRSLNFLKKV